MWIYQLFKSEVDFKSGEYLLNNGAEIDTIIAALEKGPDNDQVFTFTIRPGETIFDVKQNLIDLGYTAAEVDKAFQAKRFPLSPHFPRSDKPFTWKNTPCSWEKANIMGDSL